MKNIRTDWKIYIVGHNTISDTMYQNDSQFNNENYVFLNVGNQEKLDNDEKYVCINQKDLENRVELGKWWTESEGMYNLWRSGRCKNLSYIGFIHYDKELCLIKKSLLQKNCYNITERINKCLKNAKGKIHISFETHVTKVDYAQSIMADFSRPNELVGDGKNSYDYILELYNEFFHTTFSLKDMFQKKKINLCSCFLIDLETFDKMMHFFDWIVKEEKITNFDDEHKLRFQGMLAERIFGLFLLLENLPFKDLSLRHHWNKGLK